MHTNVDMAEMQMEVKQLKAKNDRDSTELDDLFAERRQKEELARQLEMEVENEKRDSENFINNLVLLTK